MEPNPIPRVGTKLWSERINVWSPWKAPSDWNRDEIPAKPGRYEMRLMTAAGQCLQFAIAQDLPAALHRGCAEMQGIVYIGRATDLHDRFWALVKTWQSNPPAKSPHHTGEKWHKHPHLQLAIDPSLVECRCMVAISVDTGDSNAGATEPLIGVNATAAEIGTVASTIAEDDRLYKFKTSFGEKPLLNTLYRSRTGGKVTDQWYDRYVAAEDDPDELSAVRQEWWDDHRARIKASRKAKSPIAGN